MDPYFTHLDACFKSESWGKCERRLCKQELFDCLIADNIHLESKILSKAEDGDGVSLGKIGDIYYKDKNYTKAFNWYYLGADNDAHSQWMLGIMFDNGHGVSVNYGLSRTWHLKAHANGYLPATCSMGHIYECDLAVDKDLKTALKYYAEAAEKGCPTSKCKVGTYYETGDVVEKDVLCALEWYHKSILHGSRAAAKHIQRLDCRGIRIDPTAYNGVSVLMSACLIHGWTDIAEKQRLRGEAQRITFENKEITAILEAFTKCDIRKK